VQLIIAQSAKNKKLTPNFSRYIQLKIMPNTKAAIRRVRRVKKQTLTNKIRKSKYKLAIKNMEKLLNLKDKEKAKKNFPKFQSILMQVAKSGTIDKKTASRKISKISKKL
tara:strand:- start:42 stop:371 length:330 start_codon:yes stop_codon:yes gene_type:complete